MHVLVFVQDSSFSNFSSFRADTEYNANFDALSSKHANSDKVQFLNVYLNL